MAPAPPTPPSPDTSTLTGESQGKKTLKDLVKLNQASRLDSISMLKMATKRIAGVNILVHGLKGDLDSNCYEFRRRGFITRYALQEKPASTAAVSTATTATPTSTSTGSDQAVYSLVVSLSPKLHMKLAIAHGLPMVSVLKSNQADVTKIVNFALPILDRMNVNFEAAWLMHNSEQLNKLGCHEEQHLIGLNDYYGSQIALYFGWLSFYTRILVVPSLAGGILFLLQLYSGQVDNMWSPFFMLLLCVWSSVFMELWKQRSATLSYCWGTLDADEKEYRAQIMKSIGLPQPDRISRYAVTIPAVLTMIFGLLNLMIYFIDQSDRAHEIYGDSYMVYLPTVLYSLVPPLATFLYDKVVVILNDFELHSTKTASNYNLVLKKFGFQFVNCYAALMYVAFYLQDLDRLRNLLASMLIVNAIIDNIREVYAPAVTKKGLKAYEKYKNLTPKSSVTGINLDSSFDSSVADTIWMKKVIEELELPEYILSDDYLELVIQYGYITMFAVAFPIAPLLAYLNNLMEAKVDFIKLKGCRRPNIVNQTTIGGWYSCLNIITFASVLSNCFLLCIVSENFKTFVPSSMESLLESPQSKFVVMIVLEHIIFALKWILSGMIEDVPYWIREKMAQEADRIDHSLAEERFTHFIGNAKKNPFANLAGPGMSENSSKNTERNIVANKIVSEHSSEFGYNPMFLLTVVCLPLFLDLLNSCLIGTSSDPLSPPRWFTPWAYVPLAVIFLSYLKTSKDRKDRQSAIGIVSDPNILKYMYEEMPNWVEDSDTEQVKWLNGVVHKLWPNISLATEDYVKTWYQPMLDECKPSFVSSLSFSRITMGTIPFSITGIRNYNNADESCVRLDLEVKWAGNPEFHIDVGASVPLKLQLIDIRISATIRMELVPLIPVFPCFGAMTFTCMEKPFIDFGFKTGSLNVMNLGAGEYNVAVAVKNIIHSSLTSSLLYPNKYVMPWVEDVDVAVLTTAKPVGLLNLTVLSAKKLIVGDLRSSDPYVEIRFMDVVHKTTVKNKTLNPEWNESFDIMIYDKECQFVDFTLYDHDAMSAGDFLGKTSLSLSCLPKLDEKSFDLELMDVKSGSLQISCVYTPLKKATDTKNSDEDDDEKKLDILFELSPEMLTSDILEEELDPDAVSSSSDDQDDKSEDLSSLLLTPKKSFKSMSSYDGGRSSTRSLELVKNSKGVLTVSCIRGRHFYRHSSAWNKGKQTIRPYISLSIGNVKKDTIVQKDHHDPHFAEIFNFIVNSPATSSLTIRAMHKHSMRGETILGEYTIQLSDVIRHKGSVEKEYSLQTSKNEEMFVTCKLDWVPS